MSKTIERAAQGFCASVTVLLAAVSQGSAADLGGNCCADLEERIAELEATAARKGNRKVSLTIGGFVNEGIMFWDDGKEKNAYVVTNEEERSRFKFNGTAKIDADWTVGYQIEIGVRASQENRSNQDAQGAAAIDVRYSNWFVQNKEFGKASVGLVQSAGYHITEMQTANTSFWAKEGLGGWISGYRLRKPDGTLASLTFGNVLSPGPGTNRNPGEGDRLNGVRLDTANLKGFVGSVFWGEDDVWDVALRYTGELSGFKLAGGVAYGQYTDSSGTNLRGGAVFGAVLDGTTFTGGRTEVDYFGLSASVMHLETGLYVYGAYGQQQDRERQAVFKAAVEDEDRVYYIQGGIEKKWFDPGKTTMYVEYERDDVGAAVNSGTGGARSGSSLATAGAPAAAFARIAGAEVDTWGVGINQNFEKAGLDMYIGYRNFSADVSTSSNGVKGSAVSATTEIDTFHAVVAGAKVEF